MLSSRDPSDHRALRRLSTERARNVGVCHSIQLSYGRICDFCGPVLDSLISISGFHSVVKWFSQIFSPNFSAVRRPAAIFAYTFVILGALVLGVGMCLAMEVIGSLMPLGIVIGVIGIVMVAVNYPIYKRILSQRKKKYAPEIVALSDELLNH